MKKYDMSIIDLSEVRFLSGDEETYEQAREKMIESRLITLKGNISTSQISRINEHNTPVFYSKLKWRMQRKENGLQTVFDNFADMQRNKEYTAMYLYLVFLYGYVEWRIPLDINLMSADKAMLKVFFDYFMESFRAFLEGEQSEKTK